ncbi:RNA ligase-domain-containing protein [Mycena galopus ATCC 62051]|nr:RNA ligase-domain-containing protein [Mycena galopus ATCC 62051]
MSAARPVVPSDSALIASLHAISAAKPKLIKSSEFAAPADPEIKVRSWKMDEFKYYDVPSPFPTLARGIFTVELPSRGNQEYRIVARGYDKFFNIGEVPWTTWDTLAAHTAPPYTLSLKSNGCIIFIAALTPTKLLVTSKHSIGPTPGQSVSHAEAGEAWLRKYFDAKGKTEADLAGKLWAENWTAIAELCDDDFEEHVLAYPPHLTGLHLHGLNTSSKEFHTLPQAEVDAFAEEWGFIRTASVVLGSVDEVRTFTDKCGETGSWNGEAVEGFVVRTHARGGESGERKEKKSPMPYPPGATFFFKVKFDEPYMMYRDWREVTKSLLRLDEQARAAAGAVHKGKMKRAETRVYVRWVIQEIRRDPSEFEEYGKNKGIVRTRERFLTYLATPEGQALLEAAKAGRMPPPSGVPADRSGPKMFGKTIIVPVAVPGCGKTAVSIALAHIFGFGRTQSDDVRAKKAAPVFIKNVTGLLREKEVVVADKNNHLMQHRTALRAAVAGRSPPVRLLALNWSLDGPPPPASTSTSASEPAAEPLTPSAVHAICAARIEARGANHQSLRPGETSGHAQVLWMFLNQTEPLGADEVDDVVEMDVREELEAQVRRAVGGVVRVLGLPEPEEEKVKEAVERARGYGKGKAAAPTAPKKAKPPRYFGLLPEVELDALLAAPLAAAQEPNESGQAFFAHLQKEKRVAERPHVTVVHSKALEGPGAEGGAGELWTRCGNAAGAGKGAVFACTLGHVVWNERVMAVTVDDVKLEAEAGEGQAGAEFVSGLPEEVRRRLHVTVGTWNASIAPVEGKTLVEAWRAKKSTAQGGGGPIRALPLGEVVVKARMRGLFN